MTSNRGQKGPARARQTKADTAPSQRRRPIAATRDEVRARAAARAAAAFEGFSLSKHRDRPPPATHVSAGGNAAAVQRALIEAGLRQLGGVEASSGGLTLSVRPAALKAVPSYNADDGTIGAGDMMSLLARHMKGNEFYAQGHPTLTRLGLQGQAQDLIAAAIQTEATK